MTDKEARWARVKHIRVRIMQEAYDLADRDDSEGYNSVKVMCSEVLGMINKLLEERQWQGLTEQEIKDCEKQAMVNGALPFEQRSFFARAIEAKLKEKNT